MFHGTAHDFETFTEDSIGKGADANCALGVHLAEYPDVAGEYAEVHSKRDEGATAARVLVVALPANKPTNDLNDFFKFFGEPDAGIPGRIPAIAAKDHDAFRRERQELLRAGFDVVDYEDGEQVISVSLNPKDMVIVGSLTPSAALIAREAIEALPDMFDAQARLAAIEGLPEGWCPRSLPLPKRRPRRAP